MSQTTHRPDVVITGLGLVTPVGIDVASNARQVWSGATNVARSPDLAGSEVDFSCRVDDSLPESDQAPGPSWQMGRCSLLGLRAAREAVHAAGLVPAVWDGARVAVIVGTAFGDLLEFEEAHRAHVGGPPAVVSSRLTVMAPVNMTAAYIAMELRALGPNEIVSSACASGATAVARARSLLQLGACDVVIAGGAEARLTPTVMASLDQKGALSRRSDEPSTASRPFDLDRDGLVAGEGAGMVVLERADDARARRASIRARIAGVGASADGHHPARPDPEGRGAARALHAALAEAGAVPADIGHVNAHATSTPLGDAAEAALIGRVYGADVPVTSTKGATGHLIGATGAVEIAYTALALESACVPPTANTRTLDPSVDIDVVMSGPRRVEHDVAISHSFGFGGQNAATVLTRA